MSYLFTFISLVLILKIKKVLLVSSGLGVSSCVYFGNVDTRCKAPVVPASDLPLECTSFIMDGLSVLSDNSIHYWTNEKYHGYLKDLLTANKPVFLTYGHDLGDRNSILENTAQNVQEEMKVLKPYLDQNCKGISGLIIRDKIRLSDHNNNVSSQANIVLESMRKSLPGMAIGLTISGIKFLDTCSSPQICLDYSKIDKNIDFYLLNVTNFNPCTKDFKCGTTPVSGNAPYTLDKIPKLLDDVKIPKNKVHILFRGSPTFANDDLCTRTYQEMCLHPPSNFTYCADTEQSYIDMGKFTKANLAGFIVNNIDLSDPNKSCQCSHRFPAFFFSYMVSKMIWMYHLVLNSMQFVILLISHTKKFF